MIRGRSLHFWCLFFIASCLASTDLSAQRRKARLALRRECLNGSGSFVVPERRRLTATSGCGGEVKAENAADTELKLSVFFFNDFHGRLSLRESITSPGRYYGAVPMAMKLECLRQVYDTPTHDDSLLVSVGDNIGASGLESQLFDDRPTALFLKLINVTLVGVGNHEFDKGVDVFLSQWTTCSESAILQDDKYATTRSSTEGDQALQDLRNAFTADGAPTFNVEDSMLDDQIRGQWKCRETQPTTVECSDQDRLISASHCEQESETVQEMTERSWRKKEVRKKYGTDGDEGGGDGLLLKEKLSSVWEGKPVKSRYISSNVFWKGTNESFLPPYAIWQHPSGIRVGFVSVVSCKTPTLVKPSRIVGVRFDDMALCANSIAAKIRASVDALILLCHAGPGLEYSQPEWEAFIVEVSDSYDVLLTAHTHIYLNGHISRNHKRIVIAQAGAYGEYIGHLLLSFDRQSDKKLRKVDVRVHEASADSPAIQNALNVSDNIRNVEMLIRAAEDITSHFGRQEVGRLCHSIVQGVDKHGETSRSHESPLLNTIADAMKYMVMHEEKVSTLAFINSGSVRADLTYNHSMKGAVTNRELLTMLPFNNQLVLMQLNGSDIMNVLAEQYQSVPLALGVAGLSYHYQRSNDRSVTISNVLMDDGLPLNAERLYNVVVPDFLAEGGDGFFSFLRAPNKQIATYTTIDALKAYMRSVDSLRADEVERAIDNSVSAEVSTTCEWQENSLYCSLLSDRMIDGPIRFVILMHLASEEKASEDEDEELRDQGKDFIRLKVNDLKVSISELRPNEKAVIRMFNKEAVPSDVSTVDIWGFSDKFDNNPIPYGLHIPIVLV